MTKIEILKRINKTLSLNKVDFSFVENEINILKKKLEETVYIQTIEDVKYELNKFKKKLDFASLIEEVGKFYELTRENNDKNRENINKYADILNDEIKAIQEQFTALQTAQITGLDSVVNQISEINKIEGRLNKVINQLSEDLSKNINAYPTRKEIEEVVKKSEKETQENIDKLRLEVLSRVSGGNANRQINVKSSIISSRYTDINFANTASIGWTTSNDDTNRRVNISASVLTNGGGGFTEIAISGTINDTNVTFTSGSEPSYLIINGAWYKPTGGAITWTYVGGTITLSVAIGSGSSIFGIA